MDFVSVPYCPEVTIDVGTVSTYEAYFGAHHNKMVEITEKQPYRMS